MWTNGVDERSGRRERGARVGGRVSVVSVVSVVRVDRAYGRLGGAGVCGPAGGWGGAGRARARRRCAFAASAGVVSGRGAARGPASGGGDGWCMGACGEADCGKGERGNW